MECKRSICFFAHHPRDVRVHEHSAQLAALETQLQASDPSFAAPTQGCFTARSTQASPRDGQEAPRQQMKPQHSPLGFSQSVDSFQAEQLRQLHHHMQVC